MAVVGRLVSRFITGRVCSGVRETSSFLRMVRKPAVSGGVRGQVILGQWRIPITLCYNMERSYATLLEPVNFKQESLDKVKEEVEDLPPSKVFAVVHISGRQFKITSNDLIVVNKLQAADIGDKICLEKVLLVGSEDFTLIGNPVLSKETVRVTATVIEHSRTAKVIVFKKKRRKNYKRKRGHRQDVTILRINNIDLTASSTL